MPTQLECPDLRSAPTDREYRASALASLSTVVPHLTGSHTILSSLAEHIRRLSEVRDF